MSTTALAVELLVIGYQTLVWLALAACLSPLCDDTLLNAMKDWKELVIVVSVVAAYSSGAIMNGIASRIIDPIERRAIHKRQQRPSEMRAAILVQKPEAFDHIIKNLNVPRVLRSTIFNILLVGVFLFIHFFSSNATFSELLVVAVISLGGTALAAWAWYETAENYYIHLTQTYDALRESRTES